MARIARVVIPGYPHHVVQRGVRSIDLFGNDQDRDEYLRLLSEFCDRCGIRFWAWCLMTNHVHFVAVPENGDSLARAIGEAHRRYTRMINFRESVRGHLFQERFHSFPIQNDRHLLAVARYVESNPVRARIVRRAQEYAWSSARHHVEGTEDRLVRESPLREMAGDWGRFLREDDKADAAAIRRHMRTGRPWGAQGWIGRLEKRLGRALAPRKPGRPGKRVKRVRQQK